VPGKKSIGNIKVTGEIVATSGSALGCDGRSPKNALGTPDYVYGLERVSQRRSGVSRFFLADGQGSIRTLTDSIGAVTDSNFYTAFGEDLYHSGSTLNDFKYVGEQLDGNSGFYYNRARWMDPKVGRFASVDPYTGQSTNPISLHRYLYANVSPIQFSDPTGKFSLTEAVTTFVVASVLTQISQVSFSRLAHPGEEIKWTGTMAAASHEIAVGVEEGAVFIDAHTTGKSGKRKDVRYLGYILAASALTKTIGPVGIQIGTFEVTTPAWLETKDWALAGAISWFGGSAFVAGASKMFIGFGKGAFKIDAGSLMQGAFSNQIGLAGATGFCFPIWSNGEP
jgi:RHS repeat-associated protein